MALPNINFLSLSQHTKRKKGKTNRDSFPELISRKLKLRHLRQYSIPPSRVDISNKSFNAVY
ncbi:hypothetical protein SDJN02_07481, partial [Cucurbita argyrosperma subsp. argyrosperma]